MVGTASQGGEASSACAVAQVVYSQHALDHLERLIGFLEGCDTLAAAAAASTIVDAITILSRHPHIGRVVEEPIRELVISFGNTGYLALYRFLPERDEVRVLAIRHQRELDYPSE